jgi:diamine N-acetyltransferase
MESHILQKKIDPIEVESEQYGRHPEVVIRSERICLRLTTESDLSFVLETEYQEENSQFIIPWSKQQHRAALQDEDVLHAIIETDVEKRAIGYVIIKGLRNVNQSIELMRVVITEKGQGWGRETLRLIKAWAFETQKAHRLWLDVKENNTRARHVYEAEGFVVEGKLRECLKARDIFESLIIMSMLKDEYEAVKKKKEEKA